MPWSRADWTPQDGWNPPVQTKIADASAVVQGWLRSPGSSPGVLLFASPELIVYLSWYPNSDLYRSVGGVDLRNLPYFTVWEWHAPSQP